MHSSTSHPRTRSGNEQLTIMFEHFTDQPHYTESGPASGRSSPSNSFPCTPVDVLPHSPLDAALASEDSWNLIPYDVPWGPEYYHYRAGTLPGPEGACIFLRSPTPLKNRRTQKACNKCRQRKAKVWTSFTSPCVFNVRTPHPIIVLWNSPRMHALPRTRLHLRIRRRGEAYPHAQRKSHPPSARAFGELFGAGGNCGLNVRLRLF